ncbi:hypothetical protein [Piscibacillus halophilus]|uniref:Uncharacterized protein n=1 Tax=Piscibacillus halophilus TaxID=571933 RepID=A0A1H9F5S2_9BACI|nr:hypothetical protein [Piscibacillus halophilus]SEQ33334.1 hypothetical protein SAMN05216362_11142 [Piscibacillus halophilus]
MLRHIDWQMVSFVGASMLKEYWIYYRLPQVYYWETHIEYNVNNSA